MTDIAVMFHYIHLVFLEFTKPYHSKFNELIFPALPNPDFSGDSLHSQT